MRPLDRGTIQRRRLPQRDPERLEDLGADGVQQVVLVLEMEVNRRGGNPDPFGDCPHRYGILAPGLGQQVSRRGEDLPAERLALASGRPMPAGTRTRGYRH